MTEVTKAAEEFLSKLAGSWDLVGEMGQFVLRQRLEARWVLGGTHLLIACRQTDADADRSPYEALYLVGVDRVSAEIIFSMFDSFGVANPPVPGRGRLENDRVRFHFPYETGDFYNTWILNPETEEWTMLLEQSSESGAAAFATKHLTRASG